MRRLRIALAYFTPAWRALVRWLVNSREITNFTYELDPLNGRYLAAFVAQVVGCSYDDALHYINELEQDTVLKQHIEAAPMAPEEQFFADRTVRYGRRLGWYAIVRAVKPKVVIETGVDQGLGACVLTAALARNTAEGHPGRYIGTDINPRAGSLLYGAYTAYGEVRYGDSIQTLYAIPETVDVFINDSDHAADYEAREYETIGPKLSPRAILLGDNSHATDRLLLFAQQTGRQFLFFHEKPANHWYPGAGIGAAFRTPGI